MKNLASLTERNVGLISSIEKAALNKRTTGEWVADIVTAWIGSWTFLIAQTVLLLIWIALNLFGWWAHWDPYPFILLNLALSFQAAYATPIIMMSQNRQSRISERRNRLDLQINLLAEQETTEQLRLLRLLCEKLEIPLAPPSALEQPTHPAEILKQIEKAIEPESANAVAREAKSLHRRKRKGKLNGRHD
jgi:uncharacterized membrane protein